jgi:hypothetical protein
MCRHRAVVPDPRVARLRLQQPHQRQTQRRTLKHSKDYSHRGGDHIKTLLLAKLLVDVSHPADETGPAASTGSVGIDDGTQALCFMLLW